MSDNNSKLSTIQQNIFVRRKGHTQVLILLLLFVLSNCIACSSDVSHAPVTCSSTRALSGSGSTFDYPLFSKMFGEYLKTSCGIIVTYRSVGSGTGINDLLLQRVDFGASDSPMTDPQVAKSKLGPILHIPITLGTLAISYNLPDITDHVKLTGALIANIYLGKIQYWDDPDLVVVNKNLSLPHLPITIVHRSDGSGTTGIFTHYLAAVSKEWSEQVGAGTLVTWPAGIGGSGNAGVANEVKKRPGAIGYNELTYVVANLLPYALIQNQAGRFLAPSLAGAKAATVVANIPDDLRFYIVNNPGQDTYPISGFSWVLVYQNQQDTENGKAMAQLLWWMIHNGQQYSTALVYASLSQQIVTKSEQQILKLKCGPMHIQCYVPSV